MSTTIEDMKGGMSNCCGALMYEDYGICCECGEHCDSVENEIGDGTDDRVFTEKQVAYISKMEKQCADVGCDDNGHKHD